MQGNCVSKYYTKHITTAESRILLKVGHDSCFHTPGGGGREGGGGLGISH